MEFTAKTISEYLNGSIEGNPDEKVWTVAPIEAGAPGAIAFLANPKYTKYIYTTAASIVLVGNDFKAEGEIAATLVRVADPYQAFASLLTLYQSMMPQKSGIDAKASISDSATLGEDCYVGDFAYLGDNVIIGHQTKIYPQVYLGDNVTVGDRSILYPGVKVYADCRIGSDCIIHSGTVIGSDGFGFAPTDGSYQKIPQLGNVVIEDNVEIGSNVSIDRATMGSTLIKEGVKLDNLIQVAHNVVIGKDTVMAAQVGISGSTKIGDRCMFGGQVGIAGHLTIANEVKIGAQAGLGVNVEEEGVTFWGSPAFEYGKGHTRHHRI